VTAASVWSPREADVAARAIAISHGAPDAGGRTVPLLVHDAGERWYPPLAVYPGALFVRTGVPPRLGLRLPAILAALAALVLTYVLGVRAFGDARIAAVGAAFLVVSSAWLTFGRLAGGDLLMVPAVLAWLVICVNDRQSPMRWSMAMLGGACLGWSAWAQPGGLLAVPIFLAAGVVVTRDRWRDPRALAGAAIAAAMPFVGYGVWFLLHPDTYVDTLGRWLIHPAHLRNPWQGFVAFTKWDVMSRRAGEYWGYLSPTFLFDGRAMFGVFMAVLLPLGLWTIDATVRAQRLVVVSFFVAPLAAVLLDVPRDAGLALLMAPAGALVGASGVIWLLDRARGRV
jgi:4-amino-4-deoxy-L-arabinose transferase-like glycosyltransferase